MPTTTDEVGTIPMFPDEEVGAFREEEPVTIIGEATAGEMTGDLPAIVVAEEKALIAQHHVVTGMGTLAALSDEEFRSKLAVMKAGQDRMRIIQQELLIEGEDYGRVRGIERPFLHQPGAEKLANFYGLAVRQEAERIVGRRAIQKVGEIETERGEWQSPPLAYHVRSYVHVGDFDGPIVAMGYGEASSWEEKHRYRWAKAKCPQCGREGLIKGKPDGNLKGKWWCPGKQGGCNKTFEPADPSIETPGKVENDDPHSLAETLIQMAGKRSFVAAIRRATGTSGLFTQDEDSPSVQGDADPNTGETEATVTGGTASVAPGGKTEDPTEVQLRRLVTLSKEKDLGPAGMASLLNRLWGLDVEETSISVSTAVRNLTAQQLGDTLMAMETGVLPDPSPASSPSPQPSIVPEAGVTPPTTAPRSASGAIQRTSYANDRDPLEEAKASGIVVEADGQPL